MNLKTRYTVLIIILIGISILFVLGYKNPPEKLNSTDVSAIHSISINSKDYVELTKDEIAYWNSLKFTKVSLEYPGETPDIVVDLIGEKNKFTAMYNKGDDTIFFSFKSEIEYGFLNTPSMGGWIRPLYKTKVTDDLLELLRIKK